MKLEAFDSSYFHGKNRFGDIKPTFNTLNLKKDKDADHVIGWK